MDIDKIVNFLEEGKVIIIPTDTVYGIIGDALNIETVDKIFRIKKRDYSKPMILLMNSIDMIEDYTYNISSLEKELINIYLPGELTIILNKNDKIDDLVTAGNSTVGIRIPNNKELLEIITKLNRPIVSTSANISSKDTVTSTNMLDKEIVDKVDYICDGGYINKKASTIVKVEDNKISILREGSLSDDIIKRFGDRVI